MTLRQSIYFFETITLVESDLPGSLLTSLIKVGYCFGFASTRSKNLTKSAKAFQKCDIGQNTTAIFVHANYRKWSSKLESVVEIFFSKHQLTEMVMTDKIVIVWREKMSTIPSNVESLRTHFSIICRYASLTISKFLEHFGGFA